MSWSRDRARELRHHATDAERALWYRLRSRGLSNHRFRRQHPVCGFFADFACVERKLIVELDGGQHADRLTEDMRRTDVLERAGWRVIRFWDDDVLLRCDEVLEAILAALEGCSAPSP
jgi:very-short-patch-repair endonuclease